MGDFSKLMDTSTADNMKTLKNVTSNGSNTEKIANKHTQLDKIFQNDEKLTGNFSSK